ncbi:MAG TPA: hypothetical protein VIA09_07125 [Nitrososphaeraceae archaeon]
MPRSSSDFVQIIVAIIYAVALYYTVRTFKRSKELDQIKVTETIINDLRQLDSESSSLAAGSKGSSEERTLFAYIEYYRLVILSYQYKSDHI